MAPAAARPYLVTIQLIGGLLLVGLVAKLLVDAVQIGLDRLSPPTASSKKG